MRLCLKLLLYQDVDKLILGIQLTQVIPGGAINQFNKIQVARLRTSQG
jgi:hypothetical protein